ISSNPLYGILPTFISNLSTSLQDFRAMDCKIKEISSNPLNDILPTFISNLSASLRVLRAMDCKIKGTIPMEIDIIKSIKWHSSKFYLKSPYITSRFSLYQNSFSGLIPNTLGNLSFLEELRLWSNRLTTKTPNHEQSFLSSLANCKNLHVLEISSNPLNDILPTFISNLSASLRVLRAADCKIKGTIPMEIDIIKSIIWHSSNFYLKSLYITSRFSCCRMQNTRYHSYGNL
ncbi:hypothetical protein QQP08_014782, partial [Theobroma cacao]